MKVRTVTVGVGLGMDTKDWEGVMKRACGFGQEMSTTLQDQLGLEVQTVRICTNPFEEFTLPQGLSGEWKREMIRRIKLLESIAKDNDINFLSIGPCTSLAVIKAVPFILSETRLVSCSAKADDPFDSQTFLEIARSVLEISKQDSLGSKNFNFAMTAQVKPGCPFFPSAYHEGRELSCSIGLENSSLLCQVFEQCDDSLASAELFLSKILNERLAPIDKLVEQECKKHEISYKGIDTSICPSLDSASSIVRAFESLSVPFPIVFGGPGTLSVVSMITRVLKGLSVRKSGYCGLMLPLCEDHGLALLPESRLDLFRLLQYSSVCGVGLDTIPIPGSCSPEQLALIMMDVSSMATRLCKPLSCRLFPVPEKSAGEQTVFDSPYLVNSRILHLC